MSKTYIEITNEIKTKKAEKIALNKALKVLWKTSNTVVEAKEARNALTELGRELTKLEQKRFDAYNKERNHSPINQEIFKDLINEVGSTPLTKPAAWHWGKWELSFIADYIEENYVRKQ